MAKTCFFLMVLGAHGMYLYVVFSKKTSTKCSSFDRGWLLMKLQEQQFNKCGSWVVGIRKKKHVDKINAKLGGGFKYFLFSPLFGEDYQFD